MLTTNISNLPLAYRCAIELMDNGERTQARLNGLIEHFERVYGLQCNELAQHWRESAVGICARRFWDWEQPRS